MAGGADLGHSGKDGIHIAVRRQRFHILIMPARLALDPQLLPAPAVVSHPAGLKRHAVRFLIHIGHHQHFVRLVILYDHRHMPVAVQLKLVPPDRRIEGADRNAVTLAQRLDRQQLSGVLVDRMTRYTADIVFFQKLQQLVERDFRNRDDNRGSGHGKHIFDLLLPHQDKLRYICFQKRLIIGDRIGFRHAGHDLITAELKRDFLRDIHVVLSRVVQRRLLTARIEQLLNIFHALHITRSGHGDLGLIADGLDHVERFLMLRIAVGHIIDDQFIRVIVAVKSGQCRRVRINDRTVPETLDGIAFV